MSTQKTFQSRHVSDSFLLLMIINSMIGAGIFVNAQPLTLLAGKFAGLAYLIGVAVMTPIILMLLGLAQANPVAGGMYVYVKNTLGKTVGFFSSWSYFLAKVVSMAVLLQAFCLPLKSGLFLGWLQHGINLELAIILLLAGLNIVGLKLYGPIQLLFSTLKLIPLITIIGLAGIKAFGVGVENLAAAGSGTNLLASFPIAIFAISGFEIAGTMAHTIQNPQHIRQVAIKVIGIVAALYICFQLSAQLLAGPSLASAENPFAFLAAQTNSYLGSFSLLINWCMRLSALAITFSILANNCWNLVAVAQDRLVPLASTLTKVNQHFVPWISILVEVALIAVVLLITNDQLALQSMAVFAVATNFLIISVSAIIFWLARKNYVELAIGGISLFACTLIVILSANNVINAGLSLPFLVLFVAGLGANTVQTIFNRI